MTPNPPRWLEEMIELQHRINEILMMRLEAECSTLLSFYGRIMEWLDTAEALADPYLRED